MARLLTVATVAGANRTQEQRARPDAPRWRERNKQIAVRRQWLWRPRTPRPPEKFGRLRRRSNRRRFDRRPETIPRAKKQNPRPPHRFAKLALLRHANLFNLPRPRLGKRRRPSRQSPRRRQRQARSQPITNSSWPENRRRHLGQISPSPRRKTPARRPHRLLPSRLLHRLAPRGPQLRRPVHVLRPMRPPGHRPAR